MSTARLIGFALWVFAAATGAGSGEPADLAEPFPGSAPSLYNPWIRFYAAFDRNVASDLAEGDPVPARSLGHSEFEAGLIREALHLGVAGGGAELAYPLANNLDLARPGAVSFWCRPLVWKDGGPRGNGGYVRFIRVPGVGRSVFVIERDVRQRGIDQERLVVGFFDLSGGEKHFHTVPAGVRWSSAGWHLVVVAWDATGFGTSVDGGRFTRQSVPPGRIRTDFGALPASAVWLVGDMSRETSLLDELVIYSRPLGDDEVRRLYEAGRTAPAPPAPR